MQMILGTQRAVKRRVQEVGEAKGEAIVAVNKEGPKVVKVAMKIVTTMNMDTQRAVMEGAQEVREADTGDDSDTDLEERLTDSLDIDYSEYNRNLWQAPVLYKYYHSTK